MNRILTMVCAGLLLYGAVLMAEETPVPPPAMNGGGVKLEIGTEVDTSAVDRSYLEDSGVVNLLRLVDVTLVRSAVWSRDDEQIYFTDAHGYGIFAISPEGGDPRLIFESRYLYPFDGKQYVIGRRISELCGVSRDGRYIYFNRVDCSEENGAEITIKENESGYNLIGGINVLERLDLQTGETETVGQDIMWAYMNPSGTLVGYSDTKQSSIEVVDTVTQEKWSIPVNSWYFGFIHDQYLVYRAEAEDGTFQIFRIRIQGGDPEQITFIEGGFGTIVWPDFSPDGRWMLFPEYTGDLISSGSYTNISVIKLSAVDLLTGKPYLVIPITDEIQPLRPEFSPDGERFCYISNTVMGEGSIYIQDFILPELVEDEQLAVDESTPTIFCLTGNYPNPFNPSTTITFTLPSAGTAGLTIFDVTGRKVRTLVDGMLSLGAHSVVWDGRDDTGSAVSSGVYLSRLRMGSMTATGRMMLVK